MNKETGLRTKHAFLMELIKILQVTQIEYFNPCIKSISFSKDISKAYNEMLKINVTKEVTLEVVKQIHIKGPRPNDM